MADPHNDQLAAWARDDLDQQIETTRRVLEKGAALGVGEVDVLGTIAYTMIHSEEWMSRERIASLLSVALLRLVKFEDLLLEKAKGGHS